jgi:hypothetical protein
VTSVDTDKSNLVEPPVVIVAHSYEVSEIIDTTLLASARTLHKVTLFAGDGFAWFHIDNGPAGSRPIGRLRISYGGKPGDHEIVSILQNETVGVGTDAPGAKLHIRSGTPYHTPQLKLTQSQAHDFARLRFESFGADPDNSSVAIPYPVWDLAAGTGRLNVYAEGAGNIMSVVHRWDADPRRMKLG